VVSHVAANTSEGATTDLRAVIGREPEGIRKVDRIAIRVPVQIEPAGEPNRVFLREN